ncbi:MAG: efflux RND transporter permease subunit [Chloroflexi bacterium]|nr:efflux RND transporter permease subunit [Chloroflexota bacterium]
MGLTRIAITRPLFITMVVLAMVVLGLVSYTRLGVDLYPNVDFPVTSVVTAYPGAGPETVEQLVTRPIEDAVADLNGIDYIQSYSAEGVSYVIVVFKESVNGDAASIDVERKINGIRGSLPRDAQAPSIVKADITSLPVMSLAMSGGNLADLYAIADATVVPRLSTVDGVSAVNIVGGLAREIQIRVDENKLRAYGLSILQVNNALTAENVDIPAGTVTQGTRDYQVRLNALAGDPASLANLVVANGPGGPVYLRDIATVVDTYKKQTQLSLVNGQPALGIQITKRADANTIKTTDGIKAQLAALQKELPAGVKLAIVTDTSTFTRQSLDGVQRTLIEAIILTGLVLLVFLHTWRSTLIVLLAIPTSLIATFAVMLALGFSLNMMSMMGLALTVGILVDDSIVVLENIYRHFELGETPFTAALQGRSEIGLAAIAITLVDVVVYAPVAFMSGIVGQWFRQFGLVIVAATLFSLFVSFTLTPMLASRWLRLEDRDARTPLAWFGRVWEAGYERLRTAYTRVLGWALHLRWVVVGIGLLSFAGGLALVGSGAIGSDFLPASDEGQFTVSVEMPPGTDLAATESAVRALDARIHQIPEVKDTFAAVGVAGAGAVSQPRYATIEVQLVPLAERHRSVQDVANQVRALNGTIPGLKLTAQLPSVVGSGQPISVQVKGSDPAVLQGVANQVEEIVRRTPGTVDVTNSSVIGQPEISVRIDRARAADLGLTAAQIGTALRGSIDGEVVTQLQPPAQKAIDVRVLIAGADFRTVQAVRDIPLTTATGAQVSLGQVADVVQTNGPTQIVRRDRQRVITIGADVAGRPFGDVSADLQAQFNRLSLPPGVTITMGGNTQAQSETFSQLFQALGLSILLMYMLMVALYESLLYPFVIMLSLPLAVVGAIGGLWLTGNTLNMISLIGMIMLTGLVGKNAILLVDYTNTLRRRGLERNAAILQAGPTRLRPILMTTAAMVVAMLPSALRIGEGAELRAPLAVVVIGGLLTSTLLTLVFIPAVYTIFDDLQGWIGRLLKGTSAEQPAGPAARESEPAIPSAP